MRQAHTTDVNFHPPKINIKGQPFNRSKCTALIRLNTNKIKQKSFFYQTIRDYDGHVNIAHEGRCHAMVLTIEEEGCFTPLPHFFPTPQ